MIDVDHFKAVNDRFGHQKGDEVLKGLASLISSTLRPYDTFGRYGGEEFLLVLEEVDEKRLTEVAERTRNLVEEQLRTLSKLVEPVTISIGGTLATQEDHSAEDIIRRADQALYMAKNKGRNCVVIL
jgi:diguanylate cyclase (GGDEF)-like protein